MMLKVRVEVRREVEEKKMGLCVVERVGEESLQMRYDLFFQRKRLHIQNTMLHKRLNLKPKN